MFVVVMPALGLVVAGVSVVAPLLPAPCPNTMYAVACSFSWLLMLSIPHIATSINANTERSLIWLVLISCCLPWFFICYDTLLLAAIVFIVVFLAFDGVS